MKCFTISLLAMVISTGSIAAESKPATQATIDTNNALYNNLPFKDTKDFERAQKGFIAKQDVVTVTNENGDVVWDLEEYKKFITLEAKAPDSVNPSLWRNAQLNVINGLFKVTDG
ncbi:MBL fold metallo-hydrolase, partial [Vibrio genomosp. F10 str. 9ZD137]